MIMKPPSAQACNKALETLLSSISVENGISISTSELDERILPLKILDSISDALLIAATTLSYQAGLRATSCYKRRNALLPIGQLPYEVFEQVLLQYIDAFESCNLAQGLHRLAKVSSSWYSVVKSSASLWATIHLDDPQYPLALRKSKRAPLYIRLPEFGFRQGLSQRFLNLADPERDRWRSLSVYHVPATPQMLAPLLRLSMPQLNELQLHGPGGFDFTPSQSIPHLSSTTFPHLTHLTLHGLGLLWNWITPPVLPFLRHLSIVTASRQSIESFLASLATSPLLETVDLREAWYDIQHQPNNPPESPSSIPLHHLRQLNISNVPSGLVATFIDRLHAKALSSLIIHLREYAPHLLKYVGSPKDGSSMVQTALRLSKTDRIEVAIGTTSFEILGSAATKSIFHFAVVDCRVREVIADLIEFPLLDYPDAPSIELSLDNSESLTFSTPPSFLGGMPSLKRLTFESSPSISIIKYLSHQLPDGVRWPCPLLCVVERVPAALGSRVVRELDSMIAARKADGPERPAEIDVVELMDLNDGWSDETHDG